MQNKLNKKLEVVSSRVLNSFTTLLICIAKEKGITLAELIKEMKDKNINLEPALKADSKKPN
jgi:predicted DNA-binding ribbon-helix-helix protein